MPVRTVKEVDLHFELAGMDRPVNSALDIGGIVLEFYDLFTTPGGAITTPGGVNAGGFRGISRTGADIYGFRISNSFTVMDDFTFATAETNAVPVPPTAVALAAGLPGVSRLRRRASV
jgi:hypothetical protein